MHPPRVAPPAPSRAVPSPVRRKGVGVIEQEQAAACTQLTPARPSFSDGNLGRWPAACLHSRGTIIRGRLCGPSYGSVTRWGRDGMI